jgi:hypothetical protein
MPDHDVRLAFELGQRVRASGDTSGRVGHLVAVTLVGPYEGLVRWSATDATFELLEALEDAAPGSYAEARTRLPWPVPETPG